MNVGDVFKNFCSNLAISQTDVSNISYRYKRITKQLNLDFWDKDSETANSLYVGSYGRDTDIVTSDIDMLMVLPYETYKRFNEYYGNGQSALLQAVKNSIAKTYSSTYLKGDGQVVKIDFTDGISFEIVPCFTNTDGSYTFPDSNNGGSWRKTNPKPEIATIRSGDITWNYNLKKMCRMARAWKYKWGVPMGGLLIDTLAYRFMSGWEYKDKSYYYYDWMSRDFFAYLANEDDTKAYWYAVGSNQLIYNSGKFSSKAKTCYEKALSAIEKDGNGYEHTAKSLWREIYGSSFPN